MGVWTLPIEQYLLPTAVAKSIIMVTAGANHQVKVHEFAIFFNGILSTEIPPEIWLTRATTAGTSSAATLLNDNDDDTGTVDMVGAKLFTANPTTGLIVRRFRVHTQTGLIYPFVKPLIVGVGKRLQVHMNLTPAIARTIDGWLLLEE